MLAAEIIGLFVIVLALCFTNIGGLGGGGILVPVFIGLFKFDTRTSVALSSSSFATNSMVRLPFHWTKHHPLKNGSGTKIDYNISAIMVPGIVVGSTLGVIIN